MWDFDIHRESEVDQRKRHALGIAVCRGCPAREECYRWAKTHDEQGVWGGKVFIPPRSKFIVDPENRP
ncbi:WhiB family transcription factor [Gordonia phage GodonK]|uniref:WhiB family transcription factor n=1 Tax=Gordonia phage GodonK TaxID=2562192 RepID=A0A4D6E277_9CAUD|nr:WhiB family transcription factor [Gordonia phage GodonK]QBZ72727.1 WhiB family transcription factor [Gordonia phage GodonK]